MTRQSILLALMAAASIGCIGRQRSMDPRPERIWAGADSVGVDTLAVGLTLYTVRILRGPWAISVLEADRDACWSAVAVKAGSGVVGRATTSHLLRTLADTLPFPVGGAINADFFTFVPPGIPVGAHINDSRVVSGPVPGRPTLAFDQAGQAWMGVLGTSGYLRMRGDSVPIAGWNQRRAPGVRLFDSRWGEVTDSASSLIELAVDSKRQIVAIDTAPTGLAIPSGGVVIAVDSSSAYLPMMRQARIGDDVRWEVTTTPFAPSVAVGGLPVLLRDSLVAVGLDEVGGANFGPVRHPRTAVAVRHGGRRLLFLTVDGRQPGYSEGMTLLELASFLHAIGATDAINLDGGGSTTLAVRRDDDAVAVVNRPSDRTGERPVANALALVRRCRS